jgi:hypothetical protein
MSNEELPESARRAFDSYPQLEPSSAFNRAVLDAFSLEQAKRRRTLVGRIEEFLGLGLWQFAGSGALGALFPVVVLGVLALSGQTPPEAPMRNPAAPLSWPGLSPFDPAFRREQLLV